MADSDARLHNPAKIGTLLKHWGNTENNAAVNDKQKKICEASGLDSLLTLSRMTHVKVQGLALQVINSLREKDNGEITIESEEGFRPLVDLTKFQEEDVQKEAVWSLAILASNSACQYRIDQEVGWHNFRKYAASTVPEIQAGTAILLGNLALEKRNQESLMVKGVPLLMNMLAETKDPKVRRAVVTALSNVSIIEGYGAKDIWTEQGLELMMPFIEQTEDPQLQIGALNTIANLCNHDNANELKEKVASLGGLERLVPLLGSKDEMIVKLAAMTIANMAAEEQHRKVMHDLHIEEGLVRLLDSRDEEVQLGVAMAMNALSDNDLIRNAFRDKRAAEPLKELIHVTKDRDIAKEARETLKKVAPEELANLDSKNWSESSYSDSEKSDSEYSSSYESGGDDGKKDSGRKKVRSSRSVSTDSDRSRSGSPFQNKSLGSRGGRLSDSGSDSDSDEESNSHQSLHDTESVKVQEHSSKDNGKGVLKIPMGNETASPSVYPAPPKASEIAKRMNDSVTKRSFALDGSDSNISPDEAARRRALAERRKEEEDNEREGRVNTIDIKIKAEERSVSEIERKLELQKQAKQREEDERKAADIKMLKEMLKPSDLEKSNQVDDLREPKIEEEKKQQTASPPAKRAAAPLKSDVISAVISDTLASTKSPKSTVARESSTRSTGSGKNKGKAKDGTVRSPNLHDSKGKSPARDFDSEEGVSHDGSDSERSYEDDDSDDFNNRRRSAAPRTQKSTTELLSNPPAELVQLLHSVRNKKGVSRDWLRQLDRYAALTPKLQLNRAEHIISILVYIIYSYPDEEFADIVTLALYILAVLGRYHVANQVAIRRARGGEQMQRLLHSTVDHVREHAALALGAYSLNNPPIQVESARAIPELVRLLESTQSSPGVRRAVAACLASLADNNKPNQTMIMQLGGLRAAVSLAHEHTYIRSALHLISAIVSKNETAQNAIYLDHPRFILDMLSLLNNEPTLRVNITNTLVELVKKNAQLQAKLYFSDSISKLVPLLHTTIPKQVSVNTLFLLFTLSRTNKYAGKVKTELVAARVPSLLPPFCTSKDREIADLAVALSKTLDQLRHTV